MSRSSVQIRFSRGARYYHQEAKLQARLAAVVIELVPPSFLPRRVLDVGCGSGFLSSLALGRYPEASFELIDLSPEMIKCAKEFLGDLNSVSWFQGDALSVELSGDYDLVLSNAALHWMEPTDVLFERLHQLIAVGGYLVFSIMLRGTLQELHQLRNQLFPDLQPQSMMPTMKSITELLSSKGFSIEESQVKNYSEIYQDADAFFQDLRNKGFTGGKFSRGARLLTRTEVIKLLNSYQDKYRVSGDVKALKQVYANFEIGFIRAQKASPSSTYRNLKP